MIIPVRCFTCGKVKNLLGYVTIVLPCDAQRYLGSFCATCEKAPLTNLLLQVIGNKWDDYLDLLQASYSEACVFLLPWAALARAHRFLSKTGTPWTRSSCTATAAAACS
jgi:hypothetical protein